MSDRAKGATFDARGTSIHDWQDVSQEDALEEANALLKITPARAKRRPWLLKVGSDALKLLGKRQRFLEDQVAITQQRLRDYEADLQAIETKIASVKRRMEQLRRA